MKELLEHIQENIQLISEGWFSKDKLKGRVENPDKVDMSNIFNLKYDNKEVYVKFDSSLDNDHKKQEHRMITAGPIIKKLFSKKNRLKLLKDMSVYKEYINMTDWLIDTDGRQMTHREFLEYAYIDVTYLKIDKKHVNTYVVFDDNPIHVSGVFDAHIDNNYKLVLEMEHLGN